jgi:hypothetical protein
MKAKTTVEINKFIQGKKKKTLLNGEGDISTHGLTIRTS